MDVTEKPKEGLFARRGGQIPCPASLRPCFVTLLFGVCQLTEADNAKKSQEITTNCNNTKNDLMKRKFLDVFNIVHS